jgi:hypothetical protein
MNTIELKVKSIAPYGKGFQVNAIVDGIESEFTFYGYTRKQAIEAANKTIKKEGRLPHEAHKGDK